MISTKLKTYYKYSSKVVFNQLLKYAFSQDAPFALWKLPQQKNKHIILDFSSQLKQDKLNLEDSEAGFAISPFLNKNLEDTYFIKADFHFHTGMKDVECFEFFEAETQKAIDFKAQFLENNWLKQNMKACKLPSIEFSEFLGNIKSHYQKIVAKGIEKMQAGEFQKVVLSRYKDISLNKTFDVLENFEALCNSYDNALIYIFFLPKIGLWMGATPEILIKKDIHDTFHTVALAGTQAYRKEVPISEVLWKQKEIEEQAMVSRYIINCFKKIRLREFKEHGPRTVRAGNLLHLKTKFSVDMKSTNFLELGTVMLDLLHPTSAVCGMPKQKALEFILEEEGYERQFYSGFLGPVNIVNESNIFVNLRSMQLSGDSARLYVGAGITADSNPLQEWEETEIKSQTLLNVIKGIKV